MGRLGPRPQVPPHSRVAAWQFRFWCQQTPNALHTWRARAPSPPISEQKASPLIQVGSAYLLCRFRIALPARRLSNPNGIPSSSPARRRAEGIAVARNMGEKVGAQRAYPGYPSPTQFQPRSGLNQFPFIPFVVGWSNPIRVVAFACFGNEAKIDPSLIYPLTAAGDGGGVRREQWSQGQVPTCRESPPFWISRFSPPALTPGRPDSSDQHTNGCGGSVMIVFQTTEALRHEVLRLCVCQGC